MKLIIFLFLIVSVFNASVLAITTTDQSLSTIDSTYIEPTGETSQYQHGCGDGQYFDGQKCVCENGGDSTNYCSTLCNDWEVYYNGECVEALDCSAQPGTSPKFNSDGEYECLCWDIQKPFNNGSCPIYCSGGKYDFVNRHCYQIEICSEGYFSYYHQRCCTNETDCQYCEYNQYYNVTLQECIDLPPCGLDQVIFDGYKRNCLCDIDDPNAICNQKEWKSEMDIDIQVLESACNDTNELYFILERVLQLCPGERLAIQDVSMEQTSHSEFNEKRQLMKNISISLRERKMSCSGSCINAIELFHSKLGCFASMEDVNMDQFYTPIVDNLCTNTKSFIVNPESGSKVEICSNEKRQSLSTKIEDVMSNCTNDNIKECSSSCLNAANDVLDVINECSYISSMEDYVSSNFKNTIESINRHCYLKESIRPKSDNSCNEYLDRVNKIIDQCDQCTQECITNFYMQVPYIERCGKYFMNNEKMDRYLSMKEKCEFRVSSIDVQKNTDGDLSIDYISLGDVEHRKAMVSLKNKLEMCLEAGQSTSSYHEVCLRINSLVEVKNPSNEQGFNTNSSIVKRYNFMNASIIEDLSLSSIVSVANDINPSQGGTTKTTYTGSINYSPTGSSIVHYAISLTEVEHYDQITREMTDEKGLSFTAQFKNIPIVEYGNDICIELIFDHTSESDDIVVDETNENVILKLSNEANFNFRKDVVDNEEKTFAQIHCEPSTQDELDSKFTFRTKCYICCIKENGSCTNFLLDPVIGLDSLSGSDQNSSVRIMASYIFVVYIIILMLI